MSGDLDVVRSAVRRYQRQLESPIGYCRRAAHEMSNLLADRGIPEDTIDVVQGYFRGEEGLADHFFVVVTLGGTDHIVDPTVSQFTYDQFIENKADTYVSEEELPDTGVVSPDDSVYDRYER